MPGDRHALSRLMGFAIFLVERLGKSPRRVCQRHPVLRPLRPGDRRLDLAKVERDGVCEEGILRIVVAKHPLRLGIGLDQGDARVLAAGGVEISERLDIGGEEPAGRAIFRRHVGDGGAILDGEIVEPFAEELHELADDAGAPQTLGHREHKVGGGHAFS